MPGFNGTGPMGMGPRSGGGRGSCAPGAAAFYGSGWRRGAGRGMAPFGGGRGRVFGGGRGRRWFGPAEGQSGTASIENEIELLKNQAGILENELAAIHQRIIDLGSQKSE